MSKEVIPPQEAIWAPEDAAVLFCPYCSAVLYTQHRGRLQQLVRVECDGPLQAHVIEWADEPAEGSQP